MDNRLYIEKHWLNGDKNILHLEYADGTTLRMMTTDCHPVESPDSTLTPISLHAPDGSKHDLSLPREGPAPHFEEAHKDTCHRVAYASAYMNRPVVWGDSFWDPRVIKPQEDLDPLCEDDAVFESLMEGALEGAITIELPLRDAQYLRDFLHSRVLKARMDSHDNPSTNIEFARDQAVERLHRFDDALGEGSDLKAISSEE